MGIEVVEIDILWILPANLKVLDEDWSGAERFAQLSEWKDVPITKTICRDTWFDSALSPVPADLDAERSFPNAQDKDLDSASQN